VLHKKTDEILIDQSGYFNNNPSPMFKTEYDGTLVSVNKIAKKTFEIKKTDKSIFKFLPEFNKHAITGIKPNQPLQIECEFKNKHFLFTARKDKISRKIFFYGIDITNHKKSIELIKIQRDLATALNSISDFQQGLHLCMEAAMKATRMDCGGVYLIDDETGALDLKYHIGLADEFINGTSHYEPDSPSAKIVQAGKPVYTQHISLGIPLDDIKRRENLRAIAIVPMFHENQIIGCLNLSSHTLDEFPLYARETIETIVAQVGSAIARLKAEKALQESEEKFRELADFLPQTVFELDINGNFTYANRFGFEYSGYSQQDFKEGINVIQMIAPIDREMAKQNISKIMSGEKQGGNEYTMLRKDGTTFPVLIYSRPIIKDAKTAGLRGMVIDISERKKIEDALRNREQMLQSIFRSASVGIGLVRDRILGWTNQKLCEITGYSSEEMKDQSARILYPNDEEFDKVGREKYAEIEKNGTGVIETKWQRKDGKIIDILLSSTRIDPDDLSAGVTFTALDITDRKKAEEALRKSEANLKKAQVVANVGSWVWYIQSNRLEWSEQMYHIFGIDKSNFTGNLADVIAGAIHPDDRAAVESSNLSVIRDRKPMPLEYRVIWPDGTVRTVWAEAGELIPDEGGNPRVLTGIVQDITERKSAEKNLKESEEKFRSYVDNAPDGILVLDKNGIFIDSNEAACEITGFSKEELFQKSIIDLLAAESKKGGSIYFNKVVSIGRASEELFYVRKDGRKGCCVINAVKLGNNKYLAFMKDITETKRLQEFASRAQRLETAGRIAGQVAHDFNNLLGPLIAYPGIIKDEIPENHPIVSYLKDMEKAAEQIADINQQLLTLSRRGHYVLEILNLNDIIMQVLNQMEPIPPSVHIDTNLNRNLMNIKGGASQILRVVSNLLINSFDAMKNQGRLFIQTENIYMDKTSGNYGRIPKGEYAKLTITDSGCGISREILPHIFEPFFTTKTSDKRRGSGLGLSVVHTIMEDHHGYIDLGTTIGRGTAFYLYFPITRDQLDSPLEDDVGSGDEKILVVDDDEIQREVTSRLLIKLGYKVNTAASGEKAIDLLKGDPQDLLILDMIMPDGMDGAETYRRALEINPAQKAIIVSGYAETERVNLAIQMGVGAFLRKPLTLKTIAPAIRKELDKVPVS
jgi:two-component system cell cycle sensor histidine kinase/response regulator CckA